MSPAAITEDPVHRLKRVSRTGLNRRTILNAEKGKGHAIMVTEVISIKHRENDAGAASFNTETGLGSFEFEPSFVKTGIELSPIKMPLSRRVFSFTETDFKAFRRLPGMIADSLPDNFGNAVVNIGNKTPNCQA